MAQICIFLQSVKHGDILRIDERMNVVILICGNYFHFCRSFFRNSDLYAQPAFLFIFDFTIAFPTFGCVYLLLKVGK